MKQRTLLKKRLNAFIPAAGLGERLRPLTAAIPKPLLPVMGSAAIEHALDKVLDLPVDRIGVNLYHLGDTIRAHISATGYAEKVDFFPEEPLLGTGGALWNARSLLKEKTFVVHNSDVLSGCDIVSMYERHVKNNSCATLGVHAIPAISHVGVDARGNYLGIGEQVKGAAFNRFVSFTGIAIYEPRFLDYLPQGNSHVTRAWDAALAQGERISTYDLSDCEWHDLGTLHSFAEAIFYQLSLLNAERFIGDGVNVPLSCVLDGRIVLENGCIIGSNTELNNCIVLPGTHVAEGARHKNCLLFLDHELPLPGPGAQSLAPASGIFWGGSNRLYTRIRLSDDLTAIKLKSTQHDPDFTRQIAYTGYFTDLDLPVPRLLSADQVRKQALFEDLGKTSLYSWMRNQSNEDEIFVMYSAVIKALVRFQTMDISGLPALGSWMFDRHTLLWETGYFLNRFVRGYLGKDPGPETALIAEFEALATKTDAYKKTVMHRDCQSQNILIRDNEPLFIDYQGARMGPPAYDAASLFFDPYCPLGQELRERLIQHYAGELWRAAGIAPETCIESLAYCRLQRHMQALGAYGFLSKVKGKKGFEQYIPEALRLLKQDIMELERQFPTLNGLIQSLGV
ncbi:MAG: hypothetical protein A2268_06640 [Candidatus Raymondbacteria bacterium RifOxyA12_full_50_37]|uniref:CHK kinase-like domain-containing protein n=1 Tax=Candidatus Raymondbacteria bacterium RIFOXYD12_FULL_49_13 TaxID=1817890 RepID=A0A1F7F7I5_UNCRA|nr:MAG: hypothetical protein A2268_06640 [Candidatus Raymondbacteria bacterium RifOxyA12_full_50_37]OGJ88744.1 MAG: hypothetical protein A2248_07780 [Candidatus Raymondbacteria bacterium RIFOXYA2_FULL_49_16]OGJ99013.1 MAG: hypothetical protein A2350_06685 [Candidatus Raymondbacteria bacterium RifOxyB12_full_50_8]OGK02528.1 MAG: hypothetical protein A2519_12035 [Candidatus Raymondbacteria bacterium RIFOXYD12_FULL_49_13]OGP42119.1 MAG: hypothetical protein A2324_14910 [Candidatus Raymondbacteria 